MSSLIPNEVEVAEVARRAAAGAAVVAPKVKAAPPAALKPFAFDVGGSAVAAAPKTFSTGSIGWNATAKVVVDGRIVQVNANFIVVGSKPKAD